MCRMCEGFNLDDVLALDEAAIREYGFIVRGVSDPEPTDGFVPWCYTIGLLDAAGHPELIAAGMRIEAGGQLLHGLGRRILAGQRLAVGDRVKVARGRARVGSVHPSHYEDGTFTSWHNLRAVGAIAAPALEAVQIVAPSGCFCPAHQGRSTRPQRSRRAHRSASSMNARRRFTTQYEWRAEPEWRPLEAVARLSRMSRELPSFHEGEFMYMGAVTNRRKRLTIHLYKHIDTRRYLNLDDAGHAYEYCGPAPGGCDDDGTRGRYRLHRSLDAALVAAELWIFDWEPDFVRSWPPERWDEAA